jgi:TolB-like protein
MERMTFPLPDKPSIAVLPFVNMSDDPKQEYFVDGMTEDLITDLSKLSGLFVIARNSVFTYKNKAVRIQQVAEDLGVRYVLEGSVRRAGEQVRINAQLVDATTGGHLWAERYDGSMADVFALQDKVTKKIVSALSVNLTAEEAARSSRHKGVSTEAYDAFLQGWAHYRLQTPDNIAAAVSAFERAIALEPGYAYAHAALAASYWQVWENGWINTLNTSFFRAMKEAKRHLQQAMGAPSPLAHLVASKISAAQGKYEDAVKEAERAVALDRNDSTGYAALASALILAGKAAEGADVIRQAMRLDPHYPPTYLITLGQAQFGMDRFGDAAATLERAVQRTPENEWAWVYLAAAYGHLGKTGEGQAAVEVFDELRRERGLSELTLDYVELGQFGQSLNRTRLKAGLANIPEPEWRSLIRRTTAGYEVRGSTIIDTAAAKALHEQGTMFMYPIGRFGIWVEGRIPGSVPLEPHQLSEATLRKLITEEQAVVFYGLDESGITGEGAAQATAKAMNLGFKNIYYFRPGLKAWGAAGYPVEEGP